MDLLLLLLLLLLRRFGRLRLPWGLTKAVRASSGLTLYM